MEADRSLGLPAAAQLLTVARGRRRDLAGRRDSLMLLRAQREAVLPLLDENAAKAIAAAQNTRIEIGLIDGQLILIDAALADRDVA